MPYENNPRKNDHAVEKVATAIKKFGFRVPILIKKDGTIIDGHLRYKAALAIGLEQVPCILSDDMTEVQIKAFRLSVNKVADLASWDDDLLQQELISIKDEEFSLSFLGFEINDFIEAPKLTKLNIDAPSLAWVLMAIPLHDYGKIQSKIEEIGYNPDIKIETIIT